MTEKKQNKYKNRKFIVTSAQASATPHQKFMDGLDLYAKENNAEIIILPMIGKNAQEDMDMLDSYFQFYDIEPGKRKLNDNIQIDQFYIRPYQIDPITGLDRFAQRGTSLIFASPKQRFKAIAHSNQKMPKYLTTTGACTLPNYVEIDTKAAERRRLGEISRRDHVYGALVVELIDGEKYHLRNIKANKSGTFVDLGAKYSGEERSEANLEAMVLADWHSGQTDPKIKAGTLEMIKDLQPKKLVLHDFFDGHSVSHHIAKKPIREGLIQIYDLDMHFLDGELEHCYNELMELNDANNGQEINIVFSNHMEFLHRYLEEHRFANQLHNYRISVKLLDYMAKKDYNNPVEAGIKMFGKLPKNIKFLKINDDLKVQGYQLASHGHLGANGGRGSMRSKENDFGKSITGHCHTGAALRETYTVGTMLPLDIPYIRGQGTNWTAHHGLIYDNKTVQLVNIVNGEYRVK